MDKPNMLIERLQQKQMERTMSSMRETASDLNLITKNDQMSQMDSLGTRRGLLIGQEQNAYQLQRVKLGSQTPMIRSRAMETTGSEPMLITQESGAIKNAVQDLKRQMVKEDLDQQRDDQDRDDQGKDGDGDGNGKNDLN